MINGRTVAALRTGRGWTIRELSERSGVEYTALSRIERGQRLGTWMQANALAKTLGVRLADITVQPGEAPAGRTEHGNARVA